jgi:uncharacterized protein YbjQ (UPF0145 family)
MPASDLTHSHLDAEMRYIVDGAHARVYEHVNSVRRMDLCKEVGRTVRSVLMERLGDAAKAYTIEEFEEAAVDAISGMSDETKAAGSHAISFAVAEACVVYSEALQRGIRSPYRRVKRSPGWDYDPFSQPGGFCNPLKLKYGNED